jgi:TIR domain
MSDETRNDRFDMFVSYAHLDNQGEHAGKVTALVEAIKSDYLRVTGGALRVFFDTEEIRSMDAWESRIHQGLRESRMMVAILSPGYFASDYCRKEWEVYVETDGPNARRYYEDGLKITKRLAEISLENADYARDLAASYQRMNDLQSCRAVLRGMRARGMDLDPAAASLLEQLERMP